MLLSTKNLQLRRPSRKLSNKYEGPFQVEKAVGNHGLAYRLLLPPRVRIHPVFPVSVLEPYRAREGEEPEMPADVGYVTDEVYEVERILGHKGEGRKRQFFTQWKGYPMEECSWEPREQFNAGPLLQAYEAAIAQGTASEVPEEVQDYQDWLRNSRVGRAVEGLVAEGEGGGS